MIVVSVRSTALSAVSGTQTVIFRRCGRVIAVWRDEAVATAPACQTRIGHRPRRRRRQYPARVMLGATARRTMWPVDGFDVVIRVARLALESSAAGVETLEWSVGRVAAAYGVDA